MPLPRQDVDYQKDLAKQRQEDAAAMAACWKCKREKNTSRALHLAVHVKSKGAPDVL